MREYKLGDKIELTENQKIVCKGMMEKLKNTQVALNNLINDYGFLIKNTWSTITKELDIPEDIDITWNNELECFLVISGKKIK